MKKVSLFHILFLSGMCVLSSNAQNFTALKNFSSMSGAGQTNSDGAHPYAGLTASGSVLYGTAISGGTSARGTAFKVNADGTDFTVLKNFDATFSNNNTNSSGANPQSGLILLGGVLYGVTGGGGISGKGTIFKVNKDGTAYTVLKSFGATFGAKNTNSDGAYPQGRLTISGNLLYGMTSQGGDSGKGTIFKVNVDGTGYSVLKSFSATSGADETNSDGALPQAGLTLSDNVLYGTTYRGGSSGSGTIFKINIDGTGYTVLHHFTNSPDGQYPQASLTLSGNVLYGTTYQGGSWGNGTIFQVIIDSKDYAVIKNYGMTSGASETNSDGARPRAGLTLSGNVLYGTTAGGGVWGDGTIFQVNTDGTSYNVLKNFTPNDGSMPFGEVTLSSNVLYGSTYQGGNSSNGILFGLSLTPVVVGDGTNAASLGINGMGSFVYGLTILSNSSLSGSGIVIGAVTNYGTIQSTENLVFSNGVINFGTVTTTKGSTVKFYGGLFSPAVVWNSGSNYNNHTYQVFYDAQGIDWNVAESNAIGMAGHLASITSAEENNFVYSLVSNNAGFWMRDANGNGIGPWIGAFQPPGSPEAGGGWQWSDGSAFAYTNWAILEPNNLGGIEDRIILYAYQGLMTNTWDDYPNSPMPPPAGFQPKPFAYIVEFDPTPSPTILNIVPEGTKVRLLWQGQGGSNYVVQAATNLGNPFSDISSTISLPGAGMVTTNYLDAGMLTNSPTRFYRIRSK